jgi:hypothetical protein
MVTPVDTVRPLVPLMVVPVPLVIVRIRKSVEDVRCNRKQKAGHRDEPVVAWTPEVVARDTDCELVLIVIESTTIQTRTGVELCGPTSTL